GSPRSRASVRRSWGSCSRTHVPCKCGWNRSETPLFSTPWFPRKSAPHCSPVRLPFSGGVTVRRRRVARVLEERYGKTTVLSQQIPHVEGGSTEPLRSLTVRWPPARRWTGHATGILLVYDITNRWSFDGIDRWIKEIDEHAPGVPRILVGNRLHLAFKRQVPTEQARAYAEKNCMTFFEVSPLCNFNVIESFTELSRIVLMRHGMEKIWRPNRVFSLQDLCCRAIVSCTPVHLIDKLPLPVTIKSHLKSFSMANGMNAVMMHGRSYSLASGAGGGGSKGNSLKRSKSIRPPQSPPQNCSRSNCKIS
uniref:small monomeric GTPase n=1 Tax=Bos taurus TaxID=9913 RepID=A0ABI0NQ82_BOVIN